MRLLKEKEKRKKSLLGKRLFALFIFVLVFTVVAIPKSQDVFAIVKSASSDTGGITLDEGEITGSGKKESIDTEGTEIFTEHSLKEREKAFREEKTEKENILSKIFSGNNVFGEKASAEDDFSVKEMFKEPGIYTGKKEERSSTGAFLEIVAQAAGCILLIAVTVYATKKARKKIKEFKGRRNAY